MEDHIGTAYYLPTDPNLVFRMPGRRPHVPSFYPTMSKSRRVLTPVLVVPGVVLPTRKEAPRLRSRVGAAAAVRRHIWGPPDSVNGFFEKR